MNNNIEVSSYVLNGLRVLGEAIEHSQKTGNPCDNSGERFSNETFTLNAYSWSDEEDQEFNFKYKDFEVTWYKYLGRSTYQNQNISFENWHTIFTDCLKSLNISN